MPRTPAPPPISPATATTTACGAPRTCSATSTTTPRATAGYSTVSMIDARAPSSYVELHAHSAFSFLRAGSSVEALVARAADLGMDALALTDTMTLAGAVRFQV